MSGTLSVLSPVRLVQVHLQKIREEKLVFTEAGVRLMQGLRLIWGPLKAGVHLNLNEVFKRGLKKG